MEQEKLKSIIESVLFVSGEPISIAKLSKITEVSKAEVENGLMVLEGDLKNRGLRIIRKEDMLQMVSSPENSPYIENLVKSEIQENLSPAALEVLSIVAYRGPITRVDIEAIRGVNCTFTLRSLLMRGLLERAESPKESRGYLYSVSIEFLKKLGLEKIEDLPDWGELSKDERLQSVLSQN